MTAGSKELVCCRCTNTYTVGKGGRRDNVCRPCSDIQRDKVNKRFNYVCNELSKIDLKKEPTISYKGWTISYSPKPGRPGIVDWDATHGDKEIMLNGKSVEHIKEQINELEDEF